MTAGLGEHGPTIRVGDHRTGEYVDREHLLDSGAEFGGHQQGANLVADHQALGVDRPPEGLVIGGFGVRLGRLEAGTGWKGSVSRGWLCGACR
ncbi:hypothetical protein GCM10009533_52490 [Saccharopolyspora spinosporotrichia]|uniref:Uncharacterized protein n=1 Tax=Saccharopolyspora erythraea TaxID=1836 RepID=A0ABP3NP15_SACER